MHSEVEKERFPLADESTPMEITCMCGALIFMSVSFAQTSKSISKSEVKSSWLTKKGVLRDVHWTHG